MKPRLYEVEDICYLETIKLKTKNTCMLEINLAIKYTCSIKSFCTTKASLEGYGVQELTLNYSVITYKALCFN